MGVWVCEWIHLRGKGVLMCVVCVFMLAVAGGFECMYVLD